MKQFTFKQICAILKNNGFLLDRHKGSHYIFKNNIGKHISIPIRLNSVIILRLIKENNLIIV